MAALGLAALALGLASPRFWPWRARDAPTSVVTPAATPNFEVSAAEMLTALPSGCWRSLGLQDDGRGVLWIQASKWSPWEYGTPEYVRLATYFLERMPEDGFVVLFDLDKYGARHALQLRKLTALDLPQLDYHEPPKVFGWNPTPVATLAAEDPLVALTRKVAPCDWRLYELAQARTKRLLSEWSAIKEGAK